MPRIEFDIQTNDFFVREFLSQSLDRSIDRKSEALIRPIIVLASCLEIIIIKEYSRLQQIPRACVELTVILITL